MIDRDDGHLAPTKAGDWSGACATWFPGRCSRRLCWRPSEGEYGRPASQRGGAWHYRRLALSLQTSGGMLT